MPKQVIDPEKLVSQAYAIASRDGISALSVRKVAAACGIAVGSVYGYFPTKADLTAAVLTASSTRTSPTSCVRCTPASASPPTCGDFARPCAPRAPT